MCFSPKCALVSCALYMVRSDGADLCLSSAGGDLYKTYQWTQTKGIANESFYPFDGTSSACESKRWGQQVAFNPDGVHDITNATEDNMLRSLSLQPLSTGINPRDLMSYKSGVYDDPTCDGNLAHAVTHALIPV